MDVHVRKPSACHTQGHYMWMALLTLSLCTGCNMSDELFESFEQLLALSERRGVPFDRC